MAGIKSEGRLAKAMSSQIATAGEEQSAVAEDFNRNIVEITHVAEETSVDSAKSYEASKQMSREVDLLSGLLSEFNTSDAHANHLIIYSGRWPRI